MAYNVGPFLSLLTSQNKMFLSLLLILFLLFSSATTPLLLESPYNYAPAGEWPTLHIKVSRLTPILIPQNAARCVSLCACA